MNIFKNRFDNDIIENIKDVLIETSEVEVSDMVSNLGKKLEEEFKSREEKGVEKGAILSRREDILDNLNEIATLNEDLVNRINSEEDIETLKKWVKLSARAETMKEFIDKMN